MKNEIKGTDIASRLIFISMAMTVIQQDIMHIQNGPFKIKEPYIEQLESSVIYSIDFKPLFYLCLYVIVDKTWSNPSKPSRPCGMF